ncbi:FAD-binding dehydrogenase [Corynebacterium sanguinis]|uniref:FAD-binding dehydrogenase n=1 Tax=Corynebacterium sanguinis TaxID=2594913 RepID=A0A6C1U002_9CORY|nr:MULTISPECIES: FAD-binding dehydrogenase [Corynebacterium]MBA4505412.1 FAD-binding dehydrogenase [Corynebacterium sanguinis]MCT1411715.1 FAD-binding dehydrogenase [Corynebacterium sanguinis]MCT1413652.1 FAD-binding dehydrogenase [Corynebacterium sanguinis]MCT1425351.1 FAD-binding dehydrogenase [Corynebacterium sanguinis]MCT1444245.1 FAD-binding dehydrogenase [Corynebacterium sanguinis]
MNSDGARAPHNTDTPVIIVGTGLAGLVAGFEASKAGRHVIFVDQESRENLGGQAFWSLGGLFMVGSPEQKMMRVNDFEDLAWMDWENSADYDASDNDKWPRQWGREFVRFAAHDMHSYLKNLGLRVLPTIGWAERGSGDASGHGNSVPRFHVTWGTGPEVVRVFREPLLEAEKQGKVEFRFRHRVDDVIVESGRAVGVTGIVLDDDPAVRGAASNKQEGDAFEIRGAAVVIATGGIGGNLDKVRAMWPDDRWGPCPEYMVTGVPAYVDGRGIDIAKKAGANLVNTDRMWHYPEGMINWDPIWPNHGIRIIPGPSAIWMDAEGKRLPTHLFPGSDNLAALAHIGRTGHGYSWFILNQAIADKEFIFSGSEQNPDLTDKEIKKLLGKIGPGTPMAIEAFHKNGVDWVTADTVEDLVKGMNELGDVEIDAEFVERQLLERDAQLSNAFSKDIQVNYIRMARQFLGDKIVRVHPPHRILDEKKGPLIAVRLHVLTRKTLGGIETDLSGRALHADGSVFDGLFACGEVAGFGGGGMHGKNALEGTFLGGCIHSGKRVGEALGRA